MTDDQQDTLDRDAVDAGAADAAKDDVETRANGPRLAQPEDDGGEVGGVPESDANVVPDDGQGKPAPQ